MSHARQALALITLGLVAAMVGFAGASVLVSPAEPVAVARGPAPAPAVVPTSPAEPVAPPEAPAPPEAAPEAPPVRPTPAPRAPATTRPRPVSVAGPVTTAEAPPTAPRTRTGTSARTPAAPSAESGPPAAVLAEPPAPPTGIAIPPEAALPGVDPAHRILASEYASSVPGSVENADLARSLALWRTYLAPDAPGAPAGRRATIARAVRANAWWFASRGAPRGRVLLRDEDGIILTYRAGQGFIVNPVATTGRWRGLNDDVPAVRLAETLVTMGVERSARGRRFLAWEYYDREGDPEAIVPGTSGMAQARMALVFAHARAESGDRRFAQAALGALAAFTVDVDRGGVRSMVRLGPSQAPAPWYVERAYPGEDPWKGGALNGFMVTLLNLRGAAAILDRAAGGGAAAGLARDLADRAALTLQRHLPDHDSGSWSYYGLLTPGRPWRTYLADLNYHCYHVRLLGQLAAAYPDMGFAETSDRWQGYVDAGGATCPAA